MEMLAFVGNRSGHVPLSLKGEMENPLFLLSLKTY